MLNGLKALRTFFLSKEENKNRLFQKCHVTKKIYKVIDSKQIKFATLHFVLKNFSAVIRTN